MIGCARDGTPGRLHPPQEQNDIKEHSNRITDFNECDGITRNHTNKIENKIR